MKKLPDAVFKFYIELRLLGIFVKEIRHDAKNGEFQTVLLNLKIKILPNLNYCKFNVFMNLVKHFGQTVKVKLLMEFRM